VIPKAINRLITILLTAVLMLLTLLEWELGLLHIALAVALVAILPGYALTTAIFIRHSLSFIEKVAFSAGLSLALAAVGGLFLHFTRWGLQPASWAMLLGGVTLFANGVALFRMKTDPDKVDLSVTQVPLRLHQVALMLLAGLIITGAYLTARSGAENRPAPKYSQLWILWIDETKSEVTIGVHNHELVPQQYRLQLSTRQGAIAEWPLITLAPNTTWAIWYTPPRIVGQEDFLRATLYRLDSPQANYREVYLRRNHSSPLPEPIAGERVPTDATFQE
jgi:hypothetical protein